MKNYDELTAMLAQGASISRERSINLDFAKVADSAATAIQELQAENNELNQDYYAKCAELDIVSKFADDAAAAHKVERDELNAQYSDALGQISHLDAKCHELLSDKEVLLCHMHTIRNTTMSPAIASLTRVVLERMAQGGEK
jgi:hypothetical protein